MLRTEWHICFVCFDQNLKVNEFCPREKGMNSEEIAMILKQSIVTHINKKVYLWYGQVARS